jgi:hypothetical protein
VDTKTTTAALAGAASAGSVGIFSDPLLMIWLAAGSIGGSVACVALWERAGGQGRLASVAAILGQFGTGLAFGFLLAPALIMLWKPNSSPQDR